MISLILVPSGYLILDDLKRALRWLYARPATPSLDPSPVESA